MTAVVTLCESYSLYRTRSLLGPALLTSRLGLPPRNRCTLKMGSYTVICVPRLTYRRRRSRNRWKSVKRRGHVEFPHVSRDERASEHTRDLSRLRWRHGRERPRSPFYTTYFDRPTRIRTYRGRNRRATHIRHVCMRRNLDATCSPDRRFGADRVFQPRRRTTLSSCAYMHTCIIFSDCSTSWEAPNVCQPEHWPRGFARECAHALYT